MSHMKNRDGNKPRREQRQAEALVRQELASGKSAAERLEKFNATLGAGIGAARERAKLAEKQVEAPKAVAKAPSASQEQPKKEKKAKGGKKAAKAS
jgi:hypothetical protein